MNPFDEQTKSASQASPPTVTQVAPANPQTTVYNPSNPNSEVLDNWLDQHSVDLGSDAAGYTEPVQKSGFNLSLPRFAVITLIIMALVPLMTLGAYAAYRSLSHSDNQNIQTADLKPVQPSSALTAEQGKLHINFDTLVAGRQFTSTGAVLIQNQQTDGFKVQNSTGSDLLVADTANGRVGVGGAPTGTAKLQVNGNLSVNGQVIGAGNSYSLTAQGLFVGGNLVCTAAGCTNLATPALNTANFATLSGNQTFSGVNKFTAAGNVFVGDGSGLSALNAANVSSGTLNDARLSGNVALRSANNTFGGSNTFNSQIQAAAGINSVTGFSFNGTAGATFSCAPGELLQQGVIQGGIITSGLCVPGSGASIATLQEVYDASIPAQIVLSNVSGVLQIQDAASPLATNLFEVANNGGATKYFAVNNLGISVTGNVNTTGQFQVNGSQISSANLSDSASLTKQGNAFNGANQLVQLTAGGILPILNGSNLTALNASNISSGTLNDARLSANVAFLNGTQTFTGANTFSNASNSFTGGGSGLTSLNASNVSSGTLNDARLSANVALLNANNIFLGNNSFHLNSTALTVQDAASPLGTDLFTVTDNAGTTKYFEVSATALKFLGNDVCTSAGNCTGVSGGAIGGGGTAGKIPVFTGSGFTIGDSLLSQSGSTLTASGNINITTGNTYQINGTQISSAALSNDSNLAKLNAAQTFAGANTFSNASNSFSGDGSGLTNLNASNVSSGTLNDGRLSANVALLNANNVFTGDNAIHLNSTAFTVQDGVSPLGADLFTVTDNAGTTKYFEVSAAGAKVNGNDVCTAAGNCTGVSGGAIGGGGTAGKIAKFTGSGFTIGDSLISDNGSTVTVGGVLGVNTITPTATLTVGAATQTLVLQGDGSTKLTATASGITNQLVFAAPTVSGKTITIPNASGTVAVSASGPLALDAAGNLTCPTCLTSGGGGGTAGVSSVNSLTGDITLAGTANQITITPASNTLTFSLPQDIATTSSPQFTNINVTGQYQVNGSQIASSNLSDSANLVKLDATQTFTGANTFQNTADSTAAFEIQNQAGTSNLLIADTVNNKIGIGLAPSASNAAALQLASSGILIGDARLFRDTNTAELQSTGSFVSGANIASVGSIEAGGSTYPARLSAISNAGTLFLLQDTAGGTFNVLTVGLTGNTTLKNASDSAAAFQIQNAAGTSNLFIANTTSTEIGIGKAPTLGTLDVNGTIFQSGNQVCDTSGNCTGVSGGAIGGGGTAGKLAVFTGSGFTIGDSLISQSGSTVTANGNLNLTTGNQFQINGSQISSANLTNDSNLAKLDGTGPQTFTGQNLFKNAADSATAFQIQNSGAADTLFTVDTSARGVGGGNLVKIGNSTGTDTNTTILVVDNATSAPTSNLGALNGGLFYNSTTNHLNVIENGAVKELCNKTDLGCGSAGTVQTLAVVYANGSSQTDSTIALDSTRQGVIVKDNATPLSGSLFTVQNSTGATKYLDVTSAGVSVTGTASVSNNLTVSGSINSSSNASITGQINLNSTSQSTSYFTKKEVAGTGGVTAGDVVVMANDGGNARVIDTTTVKDSRVYGVAVATTAAGSSVAVAISGDITVNATGVINIGDQLVTSGTSGAVKTDNNATTGILGIALSSKGAGLGTVNVALRPVNGQYSPIFQNAANSATAFQIQNANGASLLTADTSNTKLAVVGNLNVGGRFGNRLFSDNFESGNLSLWAAKIGTITADTTTVHNGKYSAKFVSSASVTELDAPGFNTPTLYIRGWVNVASQSTTRVILATLGAGGNSWNIYRDINGGGQLIMDSSVTGGDIGPWATGLFTTNAWHQIEVRITQGNPSTTQVWFDGTQVFNDATQNNGTNNLNFAEIGSDTSADTGTFYWDDFATDTVDPGTASSAVVDDSFHVGGTSTFGNSVFLQSTSNSAAAFQIQNASGLSELAVDTSGNNIQVGSSTTDANTVLLTLDSYNNASDPAGVNGAMYYNSSLNKFRCFENGTWANCVGSGGSASLQTAYNNSTGGTTPEIKVDSTRGGVDIQDANTTIAGSLFTVRGANGSGLGTALFDVQSTGLISMQPAASLTSGQTELSQTFTNGSSTAGTVTGQNQTITVNNTSSASTTNGINISLTDNTALANSNTAINVSLQGGNTAQLQVGINSTVNNGIGIQGSSSGGSSTSCGGYTNLGVGVCGIGSSAGTGSGLTGVLGQYSGGGVLSATISDPAGTGVFGRNNGSGSSGLYSAGVKGVSRQINSGSISIGVYGDSGNTSGTGTTYGGYFTLFNGGNSGAGLHVDNGPDTNASVASFVSSAATSNAFQIQNSANAEVLNVDTTSTAAISPDMRNLVGNGDFEAGDTNVGWTAKGSSTIGSISKSWQGNGSLLVQTTTAANDGAQYPYTFTASTTYTLSLYARADTTSLSDFNIGRQDNGSDINCLTGQTLTTQWVRFSCTFTTGGTISGSNIYVKKTGTAAENFDIDGVQLQTGSVASAFTVNSYVQLDGVVNSPLTLQNRYDSGNDFQIQNSSGSTLLNADTYGGTISLTAPGSDYTDQFNSPEGPTADNKWTFFNGAGTTTENVNSAVTGDLRFNMTSGDTGQCWVGLSNCTRLMEAAPNGDFTIETKMDTLAPEAGTAFQHMLGMLAWQDSNNFLYFTQQNVDATHIRIIAEGVISGSGGTFLNSTSLNITSAPIYIRVSKVGKTWLEQYSTNGSNWINMGSADFSGFTPTSTGLIATNFGDTTSMPTADFDYFKVTLPVFQTNAVTIQAPDVADSEVPNLFTIKSPGGQQTLFTAYDVDSGRIGIGTVNPQALLQVAGDALFYNPGGNTATAFEVQRYNAGGVTQLLVDTLNAITTIGLTTTTTAQTVNIGTNNTASSSTTVNIGSAIGASATNIVGGTGNINLTPNGSSNTGVLIKPTNNSTAAFQIQNATSGSLLAVDSVNSNITLAGLDSGALGSTWGNGTVLPLGLYGSASVVANGYVYVIGGENSSSAAVQTIFYAKLNANGSYGSWSCEGPSSAACGGLTPVNSNYLPVALFDHSSVVANGYVYVLGGTTNGSTGVNTVYYARLNADGTNGAWSTTTVIPENLFTHSSVVANGYVYVIEGSSGTNKVYYAKLNADGTVGAWSNVGGPVALQQQAAVVANGYLYVVGGFDGSVSVNKIYYSALNASTGAPGGWTLINTPFGSNGLRQPTAVVSNGYLYAIGGYTGATYLPNVYYGKLNASTGSVGAMSSAVNMPNGSYGHSSVTVNGYIYQIGGYNGSFLTNVNYNSTSRVQIGANLDLVGLQGGNLADADGLPMGSVGGSITAGNGNFIGSLQVQGAANFAQGIATAGNLDVAGNLEVANNATFGGSVLLKAADNNPGLILQSTTASSTQSADLVFRDNQSTPTNLTLRRVGDAIDFVNNSGGTQAAIGLNGTTTYFAPTVGNVGIGVTGPGGKLHVIDTNTSATTFIVQDMNSQTGDLFQAETSGGVTMFSIGVSGAVLAKNSSNSPTAFQIQNSDASATLFTADTSGLVITIAGKTTAFANLTLTNAHFKSTQTTAPTIGTPTNCGTSPTSAVGAGSTDSAGSFRITIGTSPTTPTCDTVITFNQAYGAAPKSIMVVAETKDGGTGTAATRAIYVSNSSTTTFTVKFSNTGGAAGEINWFYYWVVE